MSYYYWSLNINVRCCFVCVWLIRDETPDSNTGGSDLWSNTLSLDHAGAPKSDEVKVKTHTGRLAFKPVY